MTTTPNHQPGPPVAADAADGDASSRVVRRRFSLRVRSTSDAKPGTGWTPTQRPAGSSVSRRMQMASAEKAAGFAALATCLVLCLWAVSFNPTLAWIYGGLMVPGIVVFCAGYLRMSGLQVRLDAVLARAVGAALAEGERPEMGMAA